MAIYYSVTAIIVFLFSGYLYYVISKQNRKLIWKFFSYFISIIMTFIFSMAIKFALFDFMAPVGAGLPVDVIVGRSIIYGFIGPIIGYWLFVKPINKARERKSRNSSN